MKGITVMETAAAVQAVVVPEAAVDRPPQMEDDTPYGGCFLISGLEKGDRAVVFFCVEHFQPIGTKARQASSPIASVRPGLYRRSSLISIT